MTATPAAPRSLLATWADRGTVPLDPTPLGQINQLAMTVALTVPAALTGASALAAPLIMPALRVRLLLATTPGQVRDRAWRHVGQMACTHKGDWNLFALGLAYPGLRARAWRLTEDMNLEQTAQVHFRPAGDFLLALHRLDLTRPNVAARLVGTAYDQASDRKHHPGPAAASLDDAARLPDATGGWPAPGPRAVLHQLIRQTRPAPPGQQLTELGAELIARTYLDGQKLKDTPRAWASPNPAPPSTAAARSPSSPTMPPSPNTDPASPPPSASSAAAWDSTTRSLNTSSTAPSGTPTAVAAT